ncbi:hypothetical protein ACHAWF_002276 [Thalassiosira exigua]
MRGSRRIRSRSTTSDEEGAEDVSGAIVALLPAPLPALLAADRARDRCEAGGDAQQLLASARSGVTHGVCEDRLQLRAKDARIAPTSGAASPTALAFASDGARDRRPEGGHVPRRRLGQSLLGESTASAKVVPSSALGKFPRVGEPPAGDGRTRAQDLPTCTSSLLHSHQRRGRGLRDGGLRDACGSTRE